MLPGQIDVLRRNEKVVAIRGGVGSSKTYALCWWLLRELYAYPRAAFGVIGASNVQLESGFFVSLRGILDKYGIPYKIVSSPRIKITLLDNGAVVDTYSAEMRERLRSLEIDRVVVEEPQTWEGGQETFLTLIERLRPSPSAIAHYPGISPQIRISFNPPPVGHWLHELFERRFAGVFPCYRFSLRDNVILQQIDPTYLPLIEATLPKERWPREIDGHWGTVATGVYSGFDAARNTIEAYRDLMGREALPQGLPAFAIDPTKPLRWALDFNVGWMASVVGQLHEQQMLAEMRPDQFHGAHKTARVAVPGWQRSIWYLLDEIFLENAGVPNVVREFIRRYGAIARSTGVIIYGDASGGGRSQVLDSDSAARSPWKALIRDLTSAGIRYEFRVQSRNPPIVDRIMAVRDSFSVGEDNACGLLLRAETMPQLVNDINLVQWSPGKNEIDKSDQSDEGKKRTHVSDALGYAIWYEQQRRLGREVKILDLKSR